MTVQEFIDKLSEIEDKSVMVFIEGGLFLADVKLRNDKDGHDCVEIIARDYSSLDPRDATGIPWYEDNNIPVQTIGPERPEKWDKWLSAWLSAHEQASMGIVDALRQRGAIWT